MGLGVEDLSPRARILLALYKGYGSAEEIARVTGLGLTTVYTYLRIFREARVLGKHGDKYVLTEKGSEEAKKIMEELRRIVC